MNIWQSLFLGLVQGIAEFLPISSSGHLAIFQNVFGLKEVGESDMLFEVLLHLATLISVFIVYWKDIKSIVLFLGLLVKDTVENLTSNLFFIAAALVVTGTMLFLCDRFGKGTKQAKESTVLDALVVGCGQVLALVPGLSRSGTTIAAGLSRGFDRAFAVKFSFLLSIPAILGANILTLADVISAGVDWSMLPVYLAGMAVAAVSGYFAIRLLHKIASQNSFGGFSFYCWGAGCVTLFLALIS